MPNYLIINNSTIVDSNTDIFGRNAKLSSQVSVGNTMLTSNSLNVNSIFSNNVTTSNLTSTSLNVGIFNISGNTLSTTGSIVSNQLTLNDKFNLGSFSVNSSILTFGNTYITQSTVNTVNINVSSTVNTAILNVTNKIQALSSNTQSSNTINLNVSSVLNVGSYFSTINNRMNVLAGGEHIWKTNVGNYYLQIAVDLNNNYVHNLYNANGNIYGTAHYFNLSSNSYPIWTINLPTVMAANLSVTGFTTMTNLVYTSGGLRTSTLSVDQSSSFNGNTIFNNFTSFGSDISIRTKRASGPDTGAIFFGGTGSALIYDGNNYLFNTGTVIGSKFYSGTDFTGKDIIASGGAVTTHHNNNTGDLYFGNAANNGAIKYNGSNFNINAELYVPRLQSSTELIGFNVVTNGGSLKIHHNDSTGDLYFGSNDDANINFDGSQFNFNVNIKGKTIEGYNTVAAGGALVTHANNSTGNLYFGNDFNSRIYSDGSNIVLASKSRDHYFSGTAYAEAFIQSSDKRLKNLNKYLDNSESLNYIMKMNPLSFSWKRDESNRLVMGFFAQELQDILPDIINTDINGNLTVELTQIIPLLVGSIKELKEEINTLKNN